MATSFNRIFVSNIRRTSRRTYVFIICAGPVMFGDEKSQSPSYERRARFENKARLWTDRLGANNAFGHFARTLPDGHASAKRVCRVHGSRKLGRHSTNRRRKITIPMRGRWPGNGSNSIRGRQQWPLPAGDYNILRGARIYTGHVYTFQTPPVPLFMNAIRRYYFGRIGIRYARRV